MSEENRVLGGHRLRVPRAALRVAGTINLLGDALEAWYRHNAPRLGASLAFYTILSLAPLLIVVIAVAGLISGRAAAEGQMVWQIQNLAGREGAEVVRQMLEGARQPASGILATTLGLLTLFLGATAVVGELRDALNTVWEIPIQESQWPRGVIRMLKERVFSFVMVLGVGFLLLVSLIVNVWLAAAGAFLRGLLPLPESVLPALTAVVSFVVIAALFALIYKFMPDVNLEWRDVAGGRRPNVTAIFPGQDCDRPLLGQNGPRFHLWGRGLAGGSAGVGLLLGAGLPARRGIHAGLRTSLRRRPQFAVRLRNCSYGVMRP